MGSHLMSLPGPLRAAVALLYLCAAYIGVMAVAEQSAGQTVDATAFGRAIVQSVVVALLASQLVRRARWAWFTVLTLGGVWVVLGGVAGVLLVVLGSESFAAGESPLPLSRVAAAAFSHMLMLSAIILLLNRRSRAAFQNSPPKSKRRSK
jgi:hypothetical protein